MNITYVIMRILADASLPHLFELFPTPFKLTTYTDSSLLKSLLLKNDILLCRSTLRVTSELLDYTPIQCVATASSGTDHIDHDYLNSRTIRLIDAKGCNAEAVADYVLSSVAVLQGNNRLIGSRAGVIGMGEVGTRVAARLRCIGFEVVGYDPFKTVSTTLDDLKTCDLLCIHANLHDNAPYSSLNLINADFLAPLKPGVTIINTARGGIVNENDLLSAKNSITYCTDVYLDEPEINPMLIDFSTLCTPHIAGHSIEAKQNAVISISHALHASLGLPMPLMSISCEKELPFLSTKDLWQNQVLQYYNPLNETQGLKAATNKKQAFLDLRKAHDFRHHFSAMGC